MIGQTTPIPTQQVTSKLGSQHLQMEVEPLHSLLKRLLLRPLLLRDVWVTTHGEAMTNSREQVDLVGNLCRF